MYSDLEYTRFESLLLGVRERVSTRSPDNPALFGWRAYSQGDEDGIIRECLRRIRKVASLSCRFVEVGCGNGLCNNTHQLALDGWRGVWADGDERNVSEACENLGAMELDGLWILQCKVTSANASRLACRFFDFVATNSIDLFSLNVDGSDIHVADNFVEKLSPKLVCVRYNAKFPPPSSVSMPCGSDCSWSGDDYFAASLQAWVGIMEARSYRLVSCSLSGESAFFVRQDLADGFSNYSIDELYQPLRRWMTSGGGNSSSLKWLKAELHSERYAADGVFVPAALGECRRFIVHSVNDLFISEEIRNHGVWEPFESRIFDQLCVEGDFVLDLGANIGWYSALAAKRVGGSGRVISFEPDPRNLAILNRNVALYDESGVVSVDGRAVAEHEGTFPLFLSSTNLGDHRLFSAGDCREVCNVEVTTLDSLFDGDILLPTVVKSDTQGSEARILRGASGLFSRGWRPALLIEFWPFGLRSSGDDALELWSALDGMGYRMFEVSEGRHELVVSSLERVMQRLSSDISVESGNFINLLCLHDASPKMSKFSAMAVSA